MQVVETTDTILTAPTTTNNADDDEQTVHNETMAPNVDKCHSVTEHPGLGETPKELRYRWSIWLNKTLGFHPEQLLTWTDMTHLLHRPCDPASLAATRIMFGALMLLDLPQERGMGIADKIWGDLSLCHFPLFDVIRPLPLRWMLILYGVMIVCTVMMILGWKWRFSCGTFVTIYWYLFFLDKSTWNNHSYLYGLLASILLFSDPHRCWSVDSMRNPLLRNSHVPLWSYALLRAQVFFLYFFAGIKKLDSDWLSGYSMQQLSEHWVFFPFRWMLSNESIDYYIIHLGGFTLDLCIGFLLFFDSSRKLALIFGSAFHLMNSQIFTIGMFPWVCLATMPLFCSMSWPRPIAMTAGKLRTLLSKYTPKFLQECFEFLKREREHKKVDNDSCIRRSEGIKPKEDDGENLRKLTNKPHEKPTASKTDHDDKSAAALQRNPNCYYGGRENGTAWRKNVTTFSALVFLCLQIFLPFSHFITKGYNTWTEGPYGYSWDMMVHSWDTLHLKITVIEKETQERLYLDPDAWVKNNRWASHVDMAVQFSHCIEDRLTQYGITNFSLHFDVWRSLNRRFQQRVYDPDIDILQAPWSPWHKTPWVLPMLSELSPWRERLHELQRSQEGVSPAADSIFIADFPGLVLENFLSKELSNITLEVLQGEVTVLLETPPKSNKDFSSNMPTSEPKGFDNEIPQQPRIFNRDFCTAIVDIEEAENKSKGFNADRLHYAIVLQVGEKLPLPMNALHRVITTSEIPSSFMYTFINSTLEKKINATFDQETSMKSELEMQRSESHPKQGEGSKAKPTTCSNTPWFVTTEKAAGHMKEVNVVEFIDKEDALKKTAHGVEFLSDLPTWQDAHNFLAWKIGTFKRSGVLLYEALKSIASGTPMNTV